MDPTPAPFRPLSLKALLHLWGTSFQEQTAQQKA